MPDPISAFALSLRSEDEAVEVKLQNILLEVYERGSYAVRIDYRQPVPPPKLLPAEQAWVDAVLVSSRQRSQDLSSTKPQVREDG